MTRGHLIKLVVTCSIIVLTLLLSGCVDNNGGNGNGKTEEDWREWPKVQSSIDQRSGYSAEYSE